MAGHKPCPRGTLNLTDMIPGELKLNLSLVTSLEDVKGLLWSG